jgi:hypothetical protein
LEVIGQTVGKARRKEKKREVRQKSVEMGRKGKERASLDLVS